MDHQEAHSGTEEGSCCPEEGRFPQEIGVRRGGVICLLRIIKSAYYLFELVIYLYLIPSLLGTHLVFTEVCCLFPFYAIELSFELVPSFHVVAMYVAFESIEIEKSSLFNLGTNFIATSGLKYFFKERYEYAPPLGTLASKMKSNLGLQIG